MNTFSVARLALFGGPLLALLTFYYLFHLPATGMNAAIVGGVTVLCAIWWVFEPVPIPATSLVPIGVLPLLGVITPDQVGQAYGSPLVLLFMGGFFLSATMEKSDTHKHVALFMINLFGKNSARRVVFGFMAASAALSMWISNTATSLMLLPVALAVIHSSSDKRIAVPLLLGICYSANIGGMGTPIGTPPNLIFMKIFQDTTGEEVSFIQWMMWCMPVVLVLVPFVGWWLTRGLNAEPANFDLPKNQPWTVEQKRIMVIFSLTAFAWVTRTAPYGGWKDWLNLPMANDASVGLIAAVIMFIIPNGKGGKLLDWDAAVKIPWGVLLLFSGGIVLAKAFQVSGLADLLARGMVNLTSLNALFTILLICLFVTFLTEATSNTASTSLLMPVLATAAVASGMKAAALMVPAALSASCAFMLPVATPPNAVVFGSGLVPIKRMVSAGFVLNLVAAVVIAVWFWAVIIL